MAVTLGWKLVEADELEKDDDDNDSADDVENRIKDHCLLASFQSRRRATIGSFPHAEPGARRRLACSLPSAKVRWLQMTGEGYGPRTFDLAGHIA